MTQSIKILAIGNSFSEDATNLLYPLLKDSGFTSIVIGNLYIPGCPLERHAKNSKENLPAYEYFKNTTGEWSVIKDVSIEQALKDETWNVITLQQASGLSGIPSSYHPYLEELLDHVNQYKPIHAKILWHMTWAYAQTSDHGDFVRYGNNQSTMYNAIITTVQTEILTNSTFDGVIPSGTSIQNARETEIGDNLTRDGFHLSLALGRHIAALTWCCMIANVEANKMNYVPESLTEKEMDIAKKVVDQAIKSPYKITSIIG